MSPWSLHLNICVLLLLAGVVQSEKCDEMEMGLKGAQQLDKCTSGPMTSGNLLKSLMMMNTLPGDVGRNLVKARSVPPVKEKYCKDYTQAMVNTVDNLLSPTARDSWQDLGDLERASAASQLLKSMDNTGFLMAEYLYRTNSVREERNNVALEVLFVDPKKVHPVYFSFNAQDGSSDLLMLPKKEIEHHIIPAGIRLVFSGYDQLADLLPLNVSSLSLKLELNASAVRPASRILSAALRPGREDIPSQTSVGSVYLSEPVEFSLTHTVLPKDGEKPLCVYWALESGDGDQNKKGHWAMDGCSIKSTNSSHTTCHCNHLTHFAILMAPVKVELDADQTLTLTVLTWVCLIISIPCLLVSFIIFCCLQSIQSDRTTIHKNLCACLLVADLLFLITGNQTGNKVLCGLTAGLLHFLLLAAFCWMLAEGMQLYAMLVTVFESGKSRRIPMYAASYGLPAVIVMISAAVYHQGYGTDYGCWLTTERGFIWSFLGPVCVILLLNIGFLSVTFYKMCSHSPVLPQQPSRMHTLRSWTLGAFSLLCLLGLTWISGLFFISARAIVAAYVFTIFNALQGLFIFIFHCCMQKKVKKEIFRKVRRYVSSGSIFIHPSSRRTESTGLGSSSKQTLLKRFTVNKHMPTTETFNQSTAKSSSET
uniref:adhesion G protein-coupled receptor L3-like n=1 Tax=Myxine glutinosa TaxID=7769 RepID=UPI00358ED02E